MAKTSREKKITNITTTDNDLLAKCTEGISCSDLSVSSDWEDFKLVLKDPIYRNISMGPITTNWGAKDNKWSEGIPDDWKKFICLVSLKRLAIDGLKLSSARSYFKNTQRVIFTALNAESTKKFVEMLVSPNGKKLTFSTIDGYKNVCQRLLVSFKTGESPKNGQLIEYIEFFSKLDIKSLPTEDNSEFPVLKDEFVSKFGYRCFWILQNWLMPMSNLLFALDKAMEENRLKTGDWSTSTLGTYLYVHNSNEQQNFKRPAPRKRLLEFLKEHFSKKENHFPLPEFNITVSYFGSGDRSSPKVFVPNGENSLFSEEGIMTGSNMPVLQNPGSLPLGVWKQFVFIQTSLYFLTGLLSGPRISEVRTLSATHPVKVMESHAVFNTLTFKLSSRDGGEQRPWIIPSQHGKWIQLFHQLRPLTEHLMTGYNPETFWVSRANRSKEVAGPTIIKWVRLAAKEFDLKEPTLDQKYDQFINHSFRKTIARYIAIAMVGGHKYLFDMFGHKWFEMTLHYIHSPGITEIVRNVEAELHAIGLYDVDGLKEQNERNKEFVDMVEQQRSEIVLTKYLEVIKSEGGQYIGGGVAHLRSRAADITPVFQDLKEDDIKDISAKGMAYIQIAEGVGCFKDKKDRGRCSDGHASADIEPGKCVGDCPFHVAESGRIPQLEKSIRLGIAGIEKILGELKPGETMADHRGDLRRQGLGILNAVSWLKNYGAPLPSDCEHELVKELVEADSRGNFMQVFGI